MVARVQRSLSHVTWYVAAAVALLHERPAGTEPTS
jgi:hypothetical protein